MLLAVDIGNTNVTLGIFQGATLSARWRLGTDPQRTADEYAVTLSALLASHSLSWKALTGVVVASVVPVLTDTFQDLLAGHCPAPVVWVNSQVELGLRVRVEHPDEVGADRIVNALAARTRYGIPAVVVDFGTSTNFDVVDSAGDYIGGAIAPGLAASVDTLVARTAQLRRITIARPSALIGRNTAAAMQVGAYYGYVGLVEGITHRMIAQLGADTQVIATGGLARLITAEIPRIEVVDPDLTLRGLQLIWDLNCPERRGGPSQ